MTPHPPLRCPKCGTEYGFLYSRATYEVTKDGSERLVWECDFCRYTVVTPTADAQEAVDKPNT